VFSDFEVIPTKAGESEAITYRNWLLKLHFYDADCHSHIQFHLFRLAARVSIFLEPFCEPCEECLFIESILYDTCLQITISVFTGCLKTFINDICLEILALSSPFKRID
jgi:hypothetical protein